MQVSVFGKEKKKVKIDCHNPSSKLFLIKQARRKRPEGVYVSEFLTPNKLSIFYNLRQLKRQHPDTETGQSQDITGTHALVISGPMQLLVYSGQRVQRTSRTSPNTISSEILDVNGTVTTVSKLHQDFSSLQAENVDLTRKVSLFHQLFNDKKRLISVASRLGVNIQC